MWLFASRKFRLERRAARAFGLKDYAGAVRALEELLHVIGENPNTLHALAVCRQRLGEHESAIAAAARGVAADPEHLFCLKVLAECHAARDELIAAHDYAMRALALLGPAADESGGAAGAARRIAATGDREWARWARALCNSDANADK